MVIEQVLSQPHVEEPFPYCASHGRFANPGTSWSLWQSLTTDLFLSYVVSIQLFVDKRALAILHLNLLTWNVLI